MDQDRLLSNIGLVFIIAFAFIAKFLKQPLILAYLVAGLVFGPEMGFAWVKDKAIIELISEIGLILLLFIVGLNLEATERSFAVKFEALPESSRLEAPNF